MTTIQLVQAATGELVGVADASSLLSAAGIADITIAPVDQLAEFMHATDRLREIATEAKGKAGSELVARMDRDGKWTMHTEHFEIRSASPEAGTLGYDIERLRETLAMLVANGVISHAGSFAALEVVHPTVAVSYKFLRYLVAVLDGHEPDEPAYEELRRLLLTEPETTYRVKPAGVKALLKVPAARESIEACQVPTAPPPRTARIKPKLKRMTA